MGSDNSLFYSNVEDTEGIEELFLKLQKLAENRTSPVYVINQPLDGKFEYEYQKVIVILIPCHRLLFIDYGNNDEKFEVFFEDFIDDIGQLSRKYNYISVLGRPREWKIR